MAKSCECGRNCAQVDGGGEQPHAAPQPIEGLVHVAPHDRAHLTTRIDDAEKIRGVGEPDLIQPVAADGHRMMMQTHQHRHRGAGQSLLEHLQLRGRELPAVLARHAGVQQHHAPAGQIQDAMGDERRLVEQPRHVLRIIVIAGQTAIGTPSPANSRRNSAYPPGSSWAMSPVTSMASTGQFAASE